MDTKNLNYKSDFKLFESCDAGYAVPFRFSYYTNSPKRTFEATFDGTTYDNCSLMSDGRLCVAFDDHGLGLGVLKVERRYYLSDEDYSSGVCDEVIAAAPVECVADDGTKYYLQLSATGETTIEATSQIPEYYQKGDTGDTGEDGADGTTFTPSVDSEGNISWTNDGGKENPATQNIKGPQGEKGDSGSILYPSFTINANGHLIAVVPDSESEMTIKLEDGHLILTI